MFGIWSRTFVPRILQAIEIWSCDINDYQHSLVKLKSSNLKDHSLRLGLGSVPTPHQYICCNLIDYSYLEAASLREK